MRTAFNPPRPALTLNGRRAIASLIARPMYPSDVPVRAHEGMIAMKSSLCPGTALVKRIVVDQGRTIGFMGEEARTYATPSMILDIEHTCRDLILQHVDEGEDSVGMEVNVKHLAPTLMGMTVEVSACVAAVEGRKVVLEVAVKDDLDQVGSGTHTRFVVDKAKTFERLKAKAARVAAKPQ
jgi:fluoroacetyl-CoA thioesterase